MSSSISVFTSVISVVLVIFSAVLHEIAHGWVAYKLGDPTAKRAGRLTLNPAAHLDPFGSVILPLIMAVAGGPIFAFAKPVPYDPRNLRHPRRDELLVALAGPACNFLQAIAGALLFDLLYDALTPSLALLGYGPAFWLLRILYIYVYVNLVLAFFNLIPLPPLDGSAIISPLLSGTAREKYYQIQRYSLPVLLIVLYALPMLFGVDPLGAYLEATAGNMAALLMGL
ncbi:MAG: site-2 protease family protein [Olegusella sp.]|jgi:Zn-dependent protease|nr:site-2 protease family protein [Olegusella sp.]MCI1934768.1 site-2 protease family protein [Atopobiaceae bacterium]